MQDSVPEETPVQEAPVFGKVATLAGEQVTLAEVMHVEPKCVLPFVHASSQTSCDFCENPRSQRFKFDVADTNIRELRVCGSFLCNEHFIFSKAEFFKVNDRVDLSSVENAIPSFVDSKRSWKIVRGSGDVEDGWKIARNWRVSPQLGALSKLRGEPWWRVPLCKDDKVRLTLIDDLRSHNPAALAEDVWDMLLKDVLPQPTAEPNDTFLQHFPATLWTQPCPGDAKLLELRI